MKIKSVALTPALHMSFKKERKKMVLIPAPTCPSKKKEKGVLTPALHMSLKKRKKENEKKRKEK